MNLLAKLNNKTINSVIYPNEVLKISGIIENNVSKSAVKNTPDPMNKSNLPTGVHKQKGIFTPNQRLMIWDSAGIGATGVYYYRGEPIYYQGYIDNYTAGYRYIVYQSKSGQWHYIADRHLKPNYYLGNIR
jgi:hypothetical protein